MESFSESFEKSNNKPETTKTTNSIKQLIFLIIGALIFIVIHFILFNDYMNNIQYIEYFRTLFYGLFIIVVFIFLNYYNKQKLKKQHEDYVNIIKQLKDENENYEKIITEFVKEKQTEVQNEQIQKQIENKETLINETKIEIKPKDEKPETSKIEKCENDKCEIQN